MNRTYPKSWDNEDIATGATRRPKVSCAGVQRAHHGGSLLVMHASVSMLTQVIAARACMASSAALTRYCARETGKLRLARGTAPAERRSVSCIRDEFWVTARSATFRSRGKVVVVAALEPGHAALPAGGPLPRSTFGKTIALYSI
jgi:hypothetical protein